VTNIYSVLVETIMQRASIEAGIAPISLSSDGKKWFEGLPPDEVRAMKRKFRKLWRKHLKGLNRGLGETRTRRNNKFYGVGDGNPKVLHRRASLVRSVLLAPYEAELNLVWSKFYNEDAMYSF
jgi:hypothetical protein